MSSALSSNGYYWSYVHDNGTSQLKQKHQREEEYTTSLRMAFVKYSIQTCEKNKWLEFHRHSPPKEITPSPDEQEHALVCEWIGGKLIQKLPPKSKMDSKKKVCYQRHAAW
ncbi:hypothetical protein Tco_1158791 [Tanacetum coccineum]